MTKQKQSPLTAQGIINIIWGPGINSEDRAHHLLALLKRAETSVFWGAMQMCWPTCDDTWTYRREFVKLLRQHQPFAAYVSDKNRLFFDSLPAEVTVYRGASFRRARGMSWSTSREVAEGFARGHRGITVPDAMLATLIIPKADVLMASVSRQEHEILLDPDRLPSDLKDWG